MAESIAVNISAEGWRISYTDRQGKEIYEEYFLSPDGSELVSDNFDDEHDVADEILEEGVDLNLHASSMAHVLKARKETAGFADLKENDNGSN